MTKTLIIRRHGGIGDLLMMTPALKEYGKNSEIDIIVPTGFEEVFANLNYIRKTFPASEEVNCNSYDKVIDLSDFEFNYEQIFQPEIEKTKIELFADALNVKITENKPEIELTSLEKKWAEEYLAGKSGKINIALGVKSANPERDWSIDKWKSIIAKLKKLNFNLIVVDKTCNWDDKKLIFFNNHSIRELFALISKVDYVICHDSGLLHIAAAFDKKTLAIFGPTDPRLRCVYKNSVGIETNFGIKPCWYKRRKDSNNLDFVNIDDVERKFIGLLQNE